MLSLWTKRLMACWGIDTSGVRSQESPFLSPLRLKWLRERPSGHAALSATWLFASQAGGLRATTGILATTVMLRQCKSVTLYGFGPPQKGPEAAPFHFYDVSC